MRVFRVLPLWLGALTAPATLAQSVVHDESFIPDHILRVTYSETPTGCQSRTSVVINGTIPGPALHILPGARTWVRVFNDMEDQNLTMHWHGIAQRLAPFADGTPLASQWPIPPGHFFDYEIQTENDDSGTYFYHSHVEMQEMTASGPLIVDDCGTAPFQYDDERIFHFQDYFLMADHQMASDVMGTPFHWSGETDGLILNGQGVAKGKTASAGGPGGNSGFFGSGWSSHPGGYHGHGIHRRDMAKMTQVQATSNCNLPVIDVEPGKTYRFRFIGATALSLVTAGFEGHDNLTIVQADGSEYNAPHPASHIQLGAGQRFDVIFKTKTSEELAADGNKPSYFIQFETRDRPGEYRGYGVLRYNPAADIPAAPENPVITLPTSADGWMEYALQPLLPDKNDFPTADEVTRRVIIDCELLRDSKTGRVHWELAHLSWTEFSYQTPALVDIYQRGQEAIPSLEAAEKNHGWDPRTMSFPAKIGEVLEIIFQNIGSEVSESGGIVQSHPMHGHSRHYYDIGSGQGQYNADENNAKIAQLGYRPVKRDTTMLYRWQDTVNAGQIAGWRGWRLRITNPGVWLIHCHLLSHMMMGMQSVWVVGDAEDIITIPRTVSAGYMTYGSTVFGNATYAPNMYEYFNGTNRCRPVGSS